MSKKRAASTTPVQEPTKAEVALDQAALEEGKTDENEQGNESAGSDAPAGDSTGVETTETGEADAGTGSDAEPSDEYVGDVAGEEEPATDPEVGALSAALASAVAASQQPAVSVNDVPQAVVVAAAHVVSDAPAFELQATPPTRAPSVTLTQTPLTVRTDVKAQQAGIKFQLIQDRLTEYAALMAPNAAITTTDGKAQQLNLWKVIKQTLELEGSEFLQGYSMLLDFVAQYRAKHFSDKYIYRFFGELTLSAGDKKNFNRLLHLFVATCDRATRRMGLEQVDLSRTLSGIRDTAVQQRIAEFYQI